MNRIYDNIAAGDHQKILQTIASNEGELAAVQFIKSNMEKIIEHYIGCTWGACYNTKFKELIQPYFDDVKLLDKILRSDLIKLFLMSKEARMLWAIMLSNYYARRPVLL